MPSKKKTKPLPKRLAVPRVTDSAFFKNQEVTDEPPDLDNLKVPKNPSILIYTKLYRVDRSTIMRWKKAGVDLNDPQSVKSHIETLSFKPAIYRDKIDSGSSIDGKGVKMDYNAARTRKMILEGVRIERALDREEGEWTHNEVIKQDALAAASQLKMGMLKMEVELPPMLVGMTESQMQKVIREKMDELLKSFVSKTNKLYLENGY